MEEAKQVKKNKKKTTAGSRTRSIAFVGLSIALMAVSAWVTIPIGAVPFTLQMFAFSFAIMILSPGECIAAVAGYLVLGAIGVPVFSGMRGGIGVLMGTTGGYLWGYLPASAVAALFLYALRPRVAAHSKTGKLTGVQDLVLNIIAGLIFTAIAYVCGWAQYMVVANVGPLASFTVTVAPFIGVDILKVAAAALVARAVRAAVPSLRSDGKTA